MTNYISQIDTLRFGYKIARINDTPKLMTTTFIQSLKKQNIALVITRINSENLEEVHALEDIGFRIMDIQYIWRHSIEQSINDQYLNTDVTIRPAITDDIPAFRAIAADAFDLYGHYFADKRLDKDRCREIYPDWAASVITDKTMADHTLAAVHNDKIAGFLSIKIVEKDGKKYSAGVIGAVSENCRGQNIFASLAIEGLRWGQENENSWQEHYTLAINYPVNRVFSKVGFRQVGSFITLHGWLDR
jgi:hypothetical protein